MALSMYKIYLLTVVVFLLYITNKFLREIHGENTEELGTKLNDNFIRNEAAVTSSFTEIEKTTSETMETIVDTEDNTEELKEYEQITSETLETLDNTEDNTEELDEYEKRGEHVTAACKEHHSEISARYKDVWPKESYLSVLWQDGPQSGTIYIHKAGYQKCHKCPSHSVCIRKF